MNFELLKNKHVQLALGVSLGLLILTLLLSPRRPSPDVQPPLPSPYRPELQNVSVDQRLAATTYRSSIASQLPIYVESIPTSVNLPTTINIYFLPSDPPETLRFEIYGLSYLNRDSSEFTNPNITAFRETFNHGLDLLRQKGIDPSQLIFIYGNKEYVRDTAQAWITKYALLP